MMNKKVTSESKLMQMGIITMLAIGIHNFPEEIAVSIPIYYSTGNRKKTFWRSFLSRLTEPVVAITAYLILMPFLSPITMGCIFAMVADIMVYISFDELLPAAYEYGEHHISIYGLLAGVAIMAISLILLATN